MNVVYAWRARRSFPLNLDKALVALLGIGITVLLLPVPNPDIAVTGLVVGAVVALDVALLVRTRVLAFTPASRLDERMAGMRDFAYRRAFRLLGVVLLLFLISTTVTAWVRLTDQRNEIDPGFSFVRLVSLLELLLMTPTSVISWTLAALDADRVAGGSPPLRSIITKTFLLSFVTLAIAGAAWTAAVAWLPIRSSSATYLPDNEFAITGMRCGHFVAVSQAAGGLGPRVRLQAEVCWDGRRAILFGRGGSGLPGEPPAAIDTLTPYTTCRADVSGDDLAGVQQVCHAWTDSNGALHYQVAGTVAAFDLPQPNREIHLELMVTRAGRVARFG